MIERLMPARPVFGPPAGLSLRMRLGTVLAVAVLCGSSQWLSSQQTAPAHPADSVHKVVTGHKKKKPAVVAPELIQPPAPPAPEPPKWPVNDPPAPPAIRWDSQGLHVEATNSSLRRILDEVATATGAKVEGLQSDERVFGTYGPGPASDVISDILSGSGYNVLMLGDEGQGTPRQIILSERTGGTGVHPPAQTFNRQPPPDEEVEQPEAEEPNQQPPPQMPPGAPPVNPGGPMTPQQRMLELQRQQMQLQQQQQQNLPVPTPPQ